MSRNKRALAAGLVLLSSVMVAPAAQADPDNWPPNGGPRGEFDPSLTTQQQTPAPTGDSTDEIILGTIAGVLVIGGAAGFVARKRYLETHPRTAHHAM
ncbi:MAG TPA: hypothetical protein VFZ64_05250 [Nocardioidaceae bacterium]